MAGESNNSNDGTSLLKEGVRLLESGDVGAAIAAFSQIIDAEPGRAVAYRLRGSAHLRQHAYDQAIADLDRAIALAPKDAVAYYLRGRARQMIKDSSGAVADFDEAIKLKPDYLKAFQCRESMQKKNPGLTAGVGQPPPSAPNGPGRWPFYGGLAFGILLICLFALNARDPGFLFRHLDASTPNLPAAAQDSSFRTAPPQPAGPLPKIPATPPHAVEWFFAHLGKETCVPVDRVSAEGHRIYYNIGTMRTPQDVQRWFEDMGSARIETRPAPIPDLTFAFNAFFPDGRKVIILLFNDEAACKVGMDMLKP